MKVPADVRAVAGILRSNPRSVQPSESEKPIGSVSPLLSRNSGKPDPVREGAERGTARHLHRDGDPIVAVLARIQRPVLEPPEQRSEVSSAVVVGEAVVVLRLRRLQTPAFIGF